MTMTTANSITAKSQKAIVLLSPILSGIAIGRATLPGAKPEVTYFALLPLTWAILTPGKLGSTGYISVMLGGVAAHLLSLKFLSAANQGEFLPLWWFAGFALAPLWPVMVYGGRIVIKRFSVPMSLLLPLLWISMEALRQILLTAAVTGESTSLLKLGLCHIKFLTLAQVASICGIDGVTWVVASANGFMADMFGMLRDRGRIAISWAVLSAASFLVPLFAAILFGSWALSQPVNSGPLVCIVPGDLRGLVQRLDEWVNLAMEDFYAQKHHGADEWTPPLLVVTSEAACGLVGGSSDKGDNASVRSIATLALECSDTNVEVLLGAIVWKDAPRIATNSLLYFEKGGKYAGQFDKTHLLPGIECPARLAKFLTAFDRRFASLDPGRRIGFAIESANSVQQFQCRSNVGGTLQCGVCICFDLWFPGLFRAHINSPTGNIPPDFFVHSADESIAYHKQFTQLSQNVARFRAIESRRPIVRCCRSGKSGIIDACGREVWVAQLDERGMYRIFTGIVPLSDGGRSCYMVIGDIVSVLSLATTCLAIMAIRACSLCQCQSASDSTQSSASPKAAKPQADKARARL